jgi:hypothetical protein
MNNLEIRAELKARGLKHWELAEALNISEFTLTRWLRREMMDSRKKEILSMIQCIDKDKGCKSNEQC